MLQLIQREAHALRGTGLRGSAVYLTQQLYKCAADLAKPSLKVLLGSLRRNLTAVNLPHILPSWRSRRESMALTRTLTGHKSSVSAVAVTPDGRRVLSASDDRTLTLWNLETGEELASIHLEGVMTCVAVVPPRAMDTNQPIDQFTIVAGDAAGNVYCLEVVEPRGEQRD